MVSSVSSGSARRMDLSVSAQDQISMILKSIKGLRKKIVLLQKQLMDEADPNVRRLLAKQIEDLQRTVELLERQIAQIEEAERRRAQMREQAHLDMVAEQKRWGQ
ncbi:FlxA-like family protein [Rugamonas rivuli]|uniref:Uncharacterized protein n=1 Tax=Rugamonas rivuli TaxID=2743358 RepID=A0A843S681_9BURK|nr:FlxA-like family protein [Rugamonas rivuli]MQA18182.1 hypothetical protein [Rugamonas rivuli]